MALKEAVKVRAYNFVTSIRTATFVIGSALIIFAALRNSVTWHVQHFWGASHDFWQNLWKCVLLITAGNEFLIYVAAPTFATFVAFWVYNMPLIALDLTKKPAFLYQYKIQEDRNVEITTRQVKHTALVVIRNQLLGIPVLYAFLPLFKWRGLMSHGSELPAFQWVLVELMVFIFVEEIMFYYSHRLLHYPSIYKYVHKIHHEWTAPISITGIYCHPIEHILSNLVPILTGPLLYGSHIATAYLWVLLATLNTSNAHCGYHFPGFPSNEAHDFHHLRFNEMFGVLGILDRFHNTDAKFRASKQYERHQTYFSLTPIKKLIPSPRRKETIWVASCPKTE